MVEFYLLTFPRFSLRKKEHKSYFGKNRTHYFRTSRCADYLLDHSGDEGCIYVYMYSHHIWQSMDQPGKAANPARGQLNRKMNISLSPCVPENLVSRDGFSRPVPRQPAHLHTQANKCMDQTYRVAHPARGQLNREN